MTRKPIGISVPYRAPKTQKKSEWVGLTPEEIKEALRKVMHTDTMAVVRAIEAKLKEKNT